METNKNRVVVTVVGKDKKGIIAAVSGALTEREVNGYQPDHPAGILHYDYDCRYGRCHSKLQRAARGAGSFRPEIRRSNFLSA